METDALRMELLTRMELISADRDAVLEHMQRTFIFLPRFWKLLNEHKRLSNLYDRYFTMLVATTGAESNRGLPL